MCSSGDVNFSHGQLFLPDTGKSHSLAASNLNDQSINGILLVLQPHSWIDYDKNIRKMTNKRVKTIARSS